MGIADAKPEQHAVAAPVVEPLGAGEEQLADPIQRIILPPPMLQGLVLDSASHLVDAAVGDADNMEGSATRLAW